MTRRQAQAQGEEFWKMTPAPQTRPCCPTMQEPESMTSTKFVGRPAKPCSKCKGAWHWVNTMGGISCVQCQPAPASLTDIASRWLVVNAGKWEQPDGFVHQSPADAHGNQPHGSMGHNASNNASAVDLTEPDSWLLDIFDDRASIGVNQPSRPQAWPPEHQKLAQWWIDLTEQNTQSLAATISRLQGQRLSHWCIVCDARLMVDQLRADCAAGADSPRELHGCLINELSELKQWLNEQEQCLIDLTGIDL